MKCVVGVLTIFAYNDEHTSMDTICMDRAMTLWSLSPFSDVVGRRIQVRGCTSEEGFVFIDVRLHPI